MQGPYTESYQPLGDLLIRQELGAVTEYRRALDLRDGIATTSFAAGGVRYRREVFASAPDQVIVVRLTADRPRSIDVDVDTRSQLRAAVTAAGGELVLRCCLPQRSEKSAIGYTLAFTARAGTAYDVRPVAGE